MWVWVLAALFLGLTCLCFQNVQYSNKTVKLSKRRRKKKKGFRDHPDAILESNDKRVGGTSAQSATTELPELENQPFCDLPSSKSPKLPQKIVEDEPWQVVHRKTLGTVTPTSCPMAVRATAAHMQRDDEPLTKTQKKNQKKKLLEKELKQNAQQQWEKNMRQQQEKNMCQQQEKNMRQQQEKNMRQQQENNMRQQLGWRGLYVAPHGPSAPSLGPAAPWAGIQPPKPATRVKGSSFW
jgi:flagellar biosynthesis GTPase FlhF